MTAEMDEAASESEWTTDEDKLISLTWGPEVDLDGLSRELDRSRDEIERRADTLGLACRPA